MTFPAGFQANTLNRMIDFLNESNRIEGIRAIDYHNAPNQKIDQGHFGALIETLQLASECKPLTPKKICHWQSLVTREQLTVGENLEENEIGHIRGPNLQKNVRIADHIPPDFSRVPTLFDQLIEEINEGLKDQEKLKDDAEYCKFLGRSFQKFEALHPFGDGNGRVGRLLAAYIATFCRRPVIVFKSEMIERNEYYRAHKTAKKMIRFMAKKIQEAIFDSERKLLLRTKQLSGLSSRYADDSSGKQETYEWHVLRPLLEEEERNSKRIKNIPFHDTNPNLRT